MTTTAQKLVNTYRSREALVTAARASCDIAVHGLVDMGEDREYYFADSSSVHVWQHHETDEWLIDANPVNVSAHNSYSLM